MAARPPLYPALSLHKSVVYPREIATLRLEAAANRSALFSLDIPDGVVALVFYPQAPSSAAPAPAPVPVAVEARVLSHVAGGRDLEEVTVQGLRRMRLVDLIEHGERPEGEPLAYPFDRAQLEPLDPEDLTQEHVALRAQLLGLYEQLTRLSPSFPKERLSPLRVYQDQPEYMLDLLCQAVKLDRSQALLMMREERALARMEHALAWMRGEQERAEVAAEVERRTKLDMEESRKEYYLRQQLKTIRKELGEDDHSADEADRYGALLDALSLDDDSTQEVRRELERLRHIQPSSSEFQVIKTFLDRFFALPWGKETEERIDLPRVRAALEEEHFGLDPVKERVLEFLAVRKLNPAHKGPILCFAGPPGVGKTSLGKAIAEAIGRKFFRISVGGVHDEAEIRGHRRTYVGAMPGKILNALARAGTRNPLLMLDEIDKLGSDHRGDPAAALLEVLDPEQNASFTDHYFNVPFDLSRVMFVVTANYLHDIPKPLLDRLEILTIEGYTETEKVNIARGHLLPKITQDHGLAEAPPAFEEEALRGLIRGWTREAGVRGLQRALQKVCRKVARERVEEGRAAPPVDLAEVARYLGPAKFEREEGIGERVVGAANGLAWTASGGEVLVIEALKMKGHGKLVITGKLGEVMKESVQAAYSFIRASAARLGVEQEVFESCDLHVHFPAGAVPKDGPSAGVAVTLALASLLSGRPARSDVAMTGEVTLRGKVLAVGGVKDKALAAHRAGIAHVALPAPNLKDLDELPDEVRESVTFHPLTHVDELLSLALVGAAPPPASPAEGVSP
ncbi:MAG: endopeptidase La [Deltaproteobacteria bacterium]|nr:endopeptidase La [Deltaproteobacteria bacterium]